MKIKNTKHDPCRVFPLFLKFEIQKIIIEKSQIIFDNLIWKIKYFLKFNINCIFLFRSIPSLEKVPGANCWVLHHSLHSAGSSTCLRASRSKKVAVLPTDLLPLPAAQITGRRQVPHPSLLPDPRSSHSSLTASRVGCCRYVVLCPYPGVSCRIPLLSRVRVWYFGKYCSFLQLRWLHALP